VQTVWLQPSFCSTWVYAYLRPWLQHLRWLWANELEDLGPWSIHDGTIQLELSLQDSWRSWGHWCIPHCSHDISFEPSACAATRCVKSVNSAGILNIMKDNEASCKPIPAQYQSRFVSCLQMGTPRHITERT
jgi:hypothetical protein